MSLEAREPDLSVDADAAAAGLYFSPITPQRPPSKMARLLSELSTPERNADSNWEIELNDETLSELRVALRERQPDEEIPPGLDAAILEKAKAALCQFAQYIPILYYARTEDFEAVLSEVFAEGVQSNEDAAFGYIKVLLDLIDQRTIQFYRSRFMARNTPELRQESPFRIEIKQWLLVSKDKIDHKKAPIPIKEALDARQIEISTIRSALRSCGTLYPDDDLAKVVAEVCSKSKRFAYSFLGLFEYNDSGGFNDIRESLISINTRRKEGTLRAHVDILPSGPELSVYARVLMVAHDKLYRAMVSSQENLSKTLNSNLEDERKKNLQFTKTIRDLTRRLGEALNDNTILSNLRAELEQAKKDLLELGKRDQRLEAAWKRERAARIRAEKQVSALQDENAQLLNQLEAEKATRVAAQEELKALRVRLNYYTQDSTSKRAMNILKRSNSDSCLVGANPAFFSSAPPPMEIAAKNTPELNLKPDEGHVDHLPTYTPGVFTPGLD